MNYTLRPNSKQSGFSLIELMIAMVIGLFIIGGVLAVFISSSQSYRSNDALSDVQESGRFALEIIAHDLRNVGYKGSCVNEVDSFLNTLHANYEADAHDLNDPILGWSDDDSEFFEGNLVGYVGGTDLVILKHAAETAEVVLSADVVETDTNFPATLNQVPNSQILVFSNGQVCNLFQNTRDTGDMAVARANAGADINNIAAELTQGFDKDEMDINILTSHLYYIGAGTTSTTALHRLTYGMGSPVDQELVEGVSAMTVRYGIASGATGTALDYSSVAGDITGDDWDDVLAVRVTLTVTGDENIEHQFTTTVALRNRLTGL